MRLSYEQSTIILICLARVDLREKKSRYTDTMDEEPTPRFKKLSVSLRAWESPLVCLTRLEEVHYQSQVEATAAQRSSR